jgi:hypothetical protein
MPLEHLDVSGRPVDQDMGIAAPALVWLALHGYLCLALRHPGTADLHTRPLMEQFVAQLGADLVDRGILLPEELAEIEDLEVRVAGHCEICGCTEDAACPGGCSWDPGWAKQGRSICSQCAATTHAPPPSIITPGDPRWAEPQIHFGGHPS